MGIGLGLPIVQGIVDRLGGWIALETETGRGTTVTVRLPARSATVAEDRTPGPNRRGRPPGAAHPPAHPAPARR